MQLVFYESAFFSQKSEDTEQDYAYNPAQYSLMLGRRKQFKRKLIAYLKSAQNFESNNVSCKWIQEKKNFRCFKAGVGAKIREKYKFEIHQTKNVVLCKFDADPEYVTCPSKFRKMSFSISGFLLCVAMNRNTQLVYWY